jgi:hypothetical protein
MAGNRRTLVQGLDYELTYHNNMNLGSASAVVEGLCHYHSTVNRGFDITTPTYSMTALLRNTSTNIIDFSSAAPGYSTTGMALDIDITNTGTGTITLDPAPVSANYTLTSFPSNNQFNPLEVRSFQVRPITGLPAGTYNETMVITGSGGASASLDLRFTVTGTAPTYIPVNDISLYLPTDQVGDLLLTGMLSPSTAGWQDGQKVIALTIEWSLVNPGTTGATLSGSTLTTTSAGTVTIRATVANGISWGVAFTKDISITVY